MRELKGSYFFKIASAFIMLFVVCAVLGSCGIFSDDTEYAIVSENNVSADGFIYSLYENDTAVITGCDDSTLTYMTIPSTVGGYRVVEVGESAFEANTVLKHIVISEGIKKISEKAFASCTSLICVDLPSTVKELGVSAFDSCSHLCEVINTSGLVKIDDGAFRFCTSLSAFDFDDGLENIGADAFYGCSHLSKVVLTDSIKTVGDAAFSYCESLVYADLGGLTEISDSLFEKCIVLVKIDMSDKVTAIGARAFRGCSSLTEIQLGKRIKTVGGAAFDDTAWVDNSTEEFIIIGDGILLRYMGSDPDVTIPKNVKSIADAFAGSDTLRNVIIGNNITEISEYSFSGCKALVSVTITGKVKSIRSGAFYGCTSLSTITLPKTLETVEDDAFENCTALDRVIFGGSRSAFEKLSIGKNNTALTSANVSFK